VQNRLNIIIYVTNAHVFHIILACHLNLDRKFLTINFLYIQY